MNSSSVTRRVLHNVGKYSSLLLRNKSLRIIDGQTGLPFIYDGLNNKPACDPQGWFDPDQWFLKTLFRIVTEPDSVLF
jgi:hypothetical protein